MYQRTIFQSSKLIRRMSTTQNCSDIKDLMSKYKTDKIYLFIGNGPKNQYKDMASVKISVRELLNNLELSHNKWIAVFGGDTFKEEKPDLGAVMHFIKKEFNPVLLAVQCWPEVDKHVDYILKYPKEIDENGRTIYGGIKNGQLIGGTNIYLGENFKSLLTGVIDIDSKGRVGTQEIEYAKSIGLKITTLKMRD